MKKMLLITLAALAAGTSTQQVQARMSTIDTIGIIAAGGLFGGIVGGLFVEIFSEENIIYGMLVGAGVTATASGIGLARSAHNKAKLKKINDEREQAITLAIQNNDHAHLATLLNSLVDDTLAGKTYKQYKYLQKCLNETTQKVLWSAATQSQSENMHASIEKARQRYEVSIYKQQGLKYSYRRLPQEVKDAIDNAQIVDEIKQIEKAYASKVSEEIKIAKCKQETPENLPQEVKNAINNAQSVDEINQIRMAYVYKQQLKDGTIKIADTYYKYLSQEVKDAIDNAQSIDRINEIQWCLTAGPIEIH